MALVSIRKTEDYSQAKVDCAIAQHFEALKVEDDLRPGMKVVIKPNLVRAMRPEHTGTTHPSVVLAVAKWLRERGVEDITVADSPGGPHIAANLKSVYSVSGLKALEGVASLNFDLGWREIKCPEGYKNISFNVINPLADADYIINVAKLKTHCMTTLSAGIKNMFGAVPGLQKPELHYKYPNPRDFSNMILEVAGTVMPNITVIDAVEAMEGNGPTSGTTRYIGLMLSSRDIYAQDYIAAKLIGLEPERVDMLSIAIEKGLLKPEEIAIEGEAFASLEPPFELPKSKKPDFIDFLPKFIRKPATKVVGALLKPLPVLEQEKCIGCAKCAESCPPKLITIKEGKAALPVKGCISCFCCQEMCPAHAIRVECRFKIKK